MNELLNFMGRYKILALSSWLFSGASSLISVVPLWYVWKISRVILFSESPEKLSRFGIFTVIFSIMAILFYAAALIFSRMLAVKISKKFPDDEDFTTKYFSQYLPDKIRASFFALGLVVSLFYVDWLLALVGIAPVILGFFVLAMMTGNNMRQRIFDKYNALRAMKTAAEEYARTSGKSIKTFQKSAQNYATASDAYTSEIRIPMMFFTLAMNAALFFLIIWGVFVGVNYGISKEFVINFIFAVMVAPSISAPLMRAIRRDENVTQYLSKIREKISKGEKL